MLIKTLVENTSIELVNTSWVQKQSFIPVIVQA
jgi:hypothetical protein